MFKILQNDIVIKNSGYFLISGLTSKLFFMALFIYIGRILGVEGLGAYGLIFALTGLIFPFSDIASSAFIRDLTTNKKKVRKFWGNFLILKSFNSLTIYILLIGITLLGPIPEKLRTPICLTGLILLWSIFSTAAQSIFISYQKIKPVALANIIGSLSIVSLSIFFILSGKGLIWIIFSFGIGEFVRALLLNLLIVQKFSKPDLKLDIKLCNKWVKEGFYLTMQRCLGRGLFRIDAIVISFISGLYVTGLYQAPYKIVMNTDIMPILFGTVFYPYYIDAGKSSLGKLKICYTRYQKYILTAGMVLCMFLFIFSKQIIVLLYGSEFLESSLILKILAFSTLFSILNSHNTTLLNALKKEKVCFYLFLFIFTLNFLLDITLIKSYGIIGVSISTVLCSLIYFVTTKRYISKLV